ncbi:MAG: phosphatase PAP2 family protein [Pedosphaera sp.]|nr:phosphatase PAP2 family protein [Pedosphaera sp.]
MEWLQSLDEGLFRFVNQSLGNPVLDRVMPWLSGNVLFVPLALLVAGLVIWRYRAKGILCVAMLMLVVPLGDSFVCKTIKQAVRRPRPYVTMADAKQRVGPTSPYAAMPSSHAANWFCATMIAWLYFRRSARFVLPLAVAVSLSRVYNGVHYPGDILAGAILGAAYGFLGVSTLEFLWQRAGKKFFPLWHEQLPTLIPTGDATTTVPHSALRTPHSALEAHWLRAGYLLLVVLTLSRWFYLSRGIIELSEDEAYQWHWSKHLALSYFSKPPLIAVAQFLGTSLFGDNEFGVRFNAPLIAAIIGFLLLRFFAREVNARTGFALLLMFTATPLLAVGSTLMTVDPLSVLFWTAAMLAGWRAMKPESGVKEWFWVGLWMGLGFLSKYTELFQLLCWAVFFALWKPARVHLRRPGPWLALVVNALCALPVLIWNQQHGWPTIAHLGKNAGMSKSWALDLDKLDNLGEFFLQELGLLNPVFFIGTGWAAIAFWRRYRDDARLVYFFSMGAPVFLVYLGWTLHSSVLPNWIAPGVLPLFCMMIIFWERRRQEGVRFFQPWFVAGIAGGLTAVVLMHDTSIVGKLTSRPIPPNIDPLNRVRGWKETAAAVGVARAKLQAEGKPVFIIGGHYGITSLVSFYLPESHGVAASAPFVFYYSSARPENQFFFWPGYRDRKGQNAIYVMRREMPVPEILTNEFESITPLPPLEVPSHDRPLHTLYLYECRNLR